MKKKTCLNCGNTHNRRKFCSDKCKDRYHNRHNPRGYFKHLHPDNRMFDFDYDYDYDYDFDGSLLDAGDYKCES